MKFDTDFEYDLWYEKKREEQVIEDYFEGINEVEDGTQS
jgi:hypothetical protein